MRLKNIVVTIVAFLLTLTFTATSVAEANHRDVKKISQNIFSKAKPPSEQIKRWFC